MTTDKNKPRTGQSIDSKVNRTNKRRAKRQASPFQRIKLGVSASAYVPSEHMQQMQQLQQSSTLKEVMNHAHRFKE
ncbi:hypothetical protein MA786_002098 [Vibrio parahaemolyticus]|nr:hypothetical protein [Vibrio parahaemolyticus]EHK2870283.1 hypothetical protein [Vibrio parahaemolyticus]EHZ2490697.1 hypothetical protein [Vibrio parahaemolyticus]EIA1620146.1 hypothetical protein [Vibrio parahaemolyticus]EIV8639319.1 hypothetical protein [Vibrio parahaemolyticus]